MKDRAVISILDKMANAIIEDGKSIIDIDIVIQYGVLVRGIEAIKSVNAYKEKIAKLEQENLRLDKENTNMRLEAQGLKRCIECKNRFDCYDEDEDAEQLRKCDGFELDSNV